MTLRVYYDMDNTVYSSINFTVELWIGNTLELSDTRDIVPGGSTGHYDAPFNVALYDGQQALVKIYFIGKVGNVTYLEQQMYVESESGSDIITLGNNKIVVVYASKNGA